MVIAGGYADVKVQHYRLFAGIDRATRHAQSVYIAHVDACGTRRSLRKRSARSRARRLDSQ
jgi:hypothetical protein